MDRRSQRSFQEAQGISHILTHSHTSKKYEDMMLYIAATSTVINTAIVIEREEEGRVYKVQRPVYYISEVLSE